MDLEADLNSLSIRSKDENEEQQQNYLDAFSYIFSEKMGLDLPMIDFLPVSTTDRFIYVYPPLLGPHNGEHRLEAINRCWHILQYLRHNMNTKGAWAARFTQKALRVSISKIDFSYAPSWMRPPNFTSKSEALSKPQEVIETEQLIVPIRWNRDKQYRGKATLDEVLEKAVSQGKKLPELAQTAVEDPRLSKSLGHFRDSIRRQYNCKELSMNIRLLRLFYFSDGTSQSVELTQQPWRVSQNIFIDDINSAFLLEVSFEALDDPDDWVYETWD